MKRFLALLLACVLVFSMMVTITACKPKNPDDQGTPGDEDNTDVVEPDNKVDSGAVNEGDGITTPPAPTPSTPVVPGEENEEGTQE